MSGMNIKPIQLVKISAAERMVTTFFFAILLHAIVIFGIGFSPFSGDSKNVTSLEVTLVQNVDDPEPLEADYLAQANQQGEGNTVETVRPQSAMTSMDAMENAGLVEGNEVRDAERMTTDEWSEDIEPEDASATAEEVLSTNAESADQVAEVSDNTPPQSAERVLVAKLMVAGTDATDPTARDRDRALASAETPREKFISVNTRESVYAAYLEAWRQRVEKVGNLNYPDDVRRQGLTGKLLIAVALNSDGTIREVKVSRRSPYPRLDDAALRIVRRAGPFPPFTRAMRNEADVLRFVYEWRFENGHLGRGTNRLATPNPQG